MAKYFTWCLQQRFLLTHRSTVYQHPVSMLKANEYATQTRHIPNPWDSQLNNDYDESKEFNEFAEEWKQCQSKAIVLLMKLLSIARSNAKQAVEDYPEFKTLSQRTLYMNFQRLREQGVYKSTIKEKKYLLIDDTDTLTKKISVIQQTNMDINNVAPLFNLPLEQLVLFGEQLKKDASCWPAGNRVVYLAEKLQCDIERICYLMSYNRHMMTLHAPKLLSITEYFLEIGMTPESILSDSQAYRYSLCRIKEKIERAQRAGVKPLKPWVVRCHEKAWTKIEERETDRRVILKPGQSIAEYLCQVFECDVDLVNFLLLKDPKNHTMHLEKFARLANLLHREGYKIEDILRSRQIFHRRYECVQERLAMWKKSCNGKLALSILLLSKKKFEEVLEARRSDNTDANPS